MKKDYLAVIISISGVIIIATGAIFSFMYDYLISNVIDNGYCNRIKLFGAVIFFIGIGLLFSKNGIFKGK